MAMDKQEMNANWESTEPSFEVKHLPNDTMLFQFDGQELVLDRDEFVDLAWYFRKVNAEVDEGAESPEEEVVRNIRELKKRIKDVPEAMARLVNEDADVRVVVAEVARSLERLCSDHGGSRAIVDEANKASCPECGNWHS